MSFNQSVLPLTFAWNERRFNESKSARNAARRCIFRAVNILLNYDLKTLGTQNMEVQHEIKRCQIDLQKYDNKLEILDNMTQLATQSLEVYFQSRMEHLRSFVTEQCRIISDGIQEEADHWKEIHAMLQQKLVVPGDLRSYGGGNGLPRTVKQSPNFSKIIEEDEEEEEEETSAHLSTLLHSRTLTPLITRTLKKSRLLSSKLSQSISGNVPSEFNMSKTIQEQTIIEEPVTLHDVSAIEKATEIEPEIPHTDFSVSLLPCIPTATNIEEEKPINRSISSTISDKTFVKTSLKPFSSDEDSEEDDDDEDDENTIIEDSYSTNIIERARPLLLTADRSIRRYPPSIREEKVSIREPLVNEDDHTKHNTSSTIVENPNISKLPTIKSADSNEEESSSTENIKNLPVETVHVPVLVENPIKRRNTRRTTIRCLRESQNDNLPPPPAPVPAEQPIKARYQTRYSTRLATAIIHDDAIAARRSTVHRRTTRFTSD